MRLGINAITHFLVDGICLAALFSGRVPDEAFMFAILLYNTLAFSTQCVVGLATDCIRNPRTIAWVEAVSVACVALGFFLANPWWASVVFIGCGNSVFHVTAGTMTLTESGGRARPLGIFVAPGAFGVTVGMLFPRIGWVLAVCALVCAAAVAILANDNKTAGRTRKATNQATGLPDPFPADAVVLLIVAVAVRAIGGSAVAFPWKTGIAWALIMTACVFAGKAAGGFVCDRLGPVRTSLISIPVAAIAIAFFFGNALVSCAGQLLLNLTMPVTLWMLYRLMPDMPALAFGLAASALWPGTIAGSLFRLTGPALWACVIVSFLFGLAAIIFAAKRYPEAFPASDGRPTEGGKA